MCVCVCVCVCMCVGVGEYMCILIYTKFDYILKLK